MNERLKKKEENNSREEGERVLIRKTCESNFCDEKKLNNNMEINRS